MSEKILKSRIIHKHAVESDWLKATNFIPKQGEIIIYDVDENCNYERAKIGDGTTNVNDLPFATPQSDWNQSDATATDYIKNRTHYVTGAQEIETVFENNSLPFELYMDDTYGYANTVEFPEYITEIYTFKIIWDGVEYTCDRTSFGSNYYIMMPTLILGNMAIEDGEYAVDSGEPFCISVDEGTGYMKISTNQAGTTHSLKIVAIYENLKQLSEKFIPGSIARVSDLEDMGSYMFEELQYKAEQTDLDAVKGLVGDKSVANQINEALTAVVPKENGQYAITTAGDGTAYTADVPSVTALTVGASFIMIPHVVSASTTPTLNVNGLGAKEIKRRLSNMATSLQSGYTNTWLAEGRPFRVTYDGTAWVVEGHEKPTSADLYGTLGLNKGGTGASTPLEARENLGVYSKEDHEWTQIYDSGDITESVNAFAGIDITGYRKIMVAIKCANDSTNPASNPGAITFVADNGTQYQFPVWYSMFASSNDVTGNMGWFDIADGWLICSNASRNLNVNNFLMNNTEGGTADNLAGIGGGMMKCTNTLSSIMVSALDQDVNYHFHAGSRLIVWGCNA